MSGAGRRPGSRLGRWRTPPAIRSPEAYPGPTGHGEAARFLLPLLARGRPPIGMSFDLEGKPTASAPTDAKPITTAPPAAPEPMPVRHPHRSPAGARDAPPSRSWSSTPATAARIRAPTASKPTRRTSPSPPPAPCAIGLERTGRYQGRADPRYRRVRATGGAGAHRATRKRRPVRFPACRFAIADSGAAGRHGLHAVRSRRRPHRQGRLQQGRTGSSTWICRAATLP